MEGSCLCGAIKVKISDPEVSPEKSGFICHCKNCQKTAGSAFGCNLVVDTSNVQITGEDNLTIYNDYETRSGKPVRRHFCKTCGNPIKSMTEIYEGKTILKMGIFGKIPAPTMEAFVKDKQTWLPKLQDGPQFKATRGGEKMDD